MSGNLQPTTPTVGGRVFHELTDSQLQSVVGGGQAGYATADAIQQQVTHRLDQGGYQTLRDAEVSAIVVELQVATATGQLPPPLTAVNGGIGLSMIWLTDPVQSASHGPHMYLFAAQGESGPEPVGEAPTDDEEVDGSLTAIHYTADSSLSPRDWELVMSNVGVDASGNRGLLSGEFSAVASQGSLFAWDVTDLFQGFVTDIVATGSGETLTVETTKYRHFEWLLSVLGYRRPPVAASDPPEHSFWDAGNRRMADWSSQQITVSSQDDFVEYPSGEVLPKTTGPESFNDTLWEYSDTYWDPNDSRVPLVDTSGDLRARFLSEDIMVADVARSGGRRGTLFEKSRLEPAFIEFLQAFYEDVAEDASQEIVLRFTSGYRTFEHNRLNAYDWPDIPESDVDRVEWVDSDTRRIVETDGTTHLVDDVTRSEHCSGRGADLYVEGTDFTVDSDDAFLRDDDTHAPLRGTLPDDSPLPSHPDVQRQSTSDGPDYWEVTNGTDIEVVDRDVGPDGQRVAKVKASDTVIGWTNRANFSGTHTPGLDTVDLAVTALNTPVEHAIDGVSPCDVRVGVASTYLHVDVKPRYQISWGAYWYYGNSAPANWSDVTDERNNTIDVNHDCAQETTPPYETSWVYTVDNDDAWLRGDGSGDDTPYEPDTERSKPADHPYNTRSEVVWDSDDDVWRIKDDVDVTVDGKATGPDGQTVVKTVTHDDSQTVLGWTNLSNLQYWKGEH